MADDEPPQDPDRAELARRVVELLSKGGTLQSLDGTEPVDKEDIREGMETHVQRARAAERQLSDTEVRAAALNIVRTAGNAVEKLKSGTSPSALRDEEHDALQAIVEVIGRPALRYSDGRVQLPPSDVGDNEAWHVFVATARSKINRASACVARVGIELSGGEVRQLGTGWRLGEDLLVTNRHVVCSAVTDSTQDPSVWQLSSSNTVIADFAATDAATRSARFQISALEYCAPEETVDFAVLRLKPAADLPEALSVDASPEALGLAPTAGRTAIYVVGHPIRRTVTSAISETFGFADGKKRCSPGYIRRLEARAPLLEHDCSTLGGNSGSCVFSLELHRVIGIHVGGRDVQATGVGSANVAVAFARLDRHRAGDIVRNGRL